MNAGFKYLFLKAILLNTHAVMMNSLLLVKKAHVIFIFWSTRTVLL